MEQVWHFPFFDLAWSGSRDALGLLAPSLAELCCQPASEGDPGGRGGMRFACAVAFARPALPPEGAQGVFPAEPERIRLEQGRFWIEAGPALARIDPARGRGELWLGEARAFAGLPHWRSRRLISDLVLAFLAREPGFALHAALLSRGGEGLLLTAPRGSGKSTFALGLVEAGWTLHTDDYALARRARGAVLLSGLRRLVHLAPDTMERFSALVGVRLGLRNITGEKEGVELLGRGSQAALLGEVAVRKILFLERGAAQDSTWARLATRDALSLLLGQVLALEAGSFAQERFQILADLAAGALLARVETGRALLDRRGEAARIVEEVDRERVA